MKRDNPEQRFHVAVASYLRLALPSDSWFTTIPAGGGGRVRGAHLKVMGYRAGTPDILIVHRGKAHWLELKAEKGVVSREQKRCILALGDAGCPSVFVCRTLDHVQSALTYWGITAKARISG